MGRGFESLPRYRSTKPRSPSAWRAASWTTRLGTGKRRASTMKAGRPAFEAMSDHVRPRGAPLLLPLAMLPFGACRAAMTFSLNRIAIAEGAAAVSLAAARATENCRV